VCRGLRADASVPPEAGASPVLRVVMWAGRGGAGRAGAGRAGAGRGGSGRVGSGRTKHHPDGLARTGNMPPLQMCVGWATIEREFTRAMRSPQPFLHCRCACKSVSLLISWADQQVK